MKNLALVKNVTMTKVLEANTGKINICKSPSDLKTLVKDLFTEAKIDTPASNRLLENIGLSRNINSALMTVYNSMLAGENLTVNIDDKK